jgi:cell division protein ZapA
MAPEDLTGNKVVVNIYGEEYPITGVSDPTHISRVADLVDSRMSTIAEGSRVKSRDKVAILAALSIASELLEKSQSLDGASDEIHRHLDSLLARLDLELSAVERP